MELRHLRYFIRAAELLNFTKAAESLYVSQPTLSVQIHQLEEELGTELFARTGRSIRLTDSGKTFLIRAQQAVRELEEGSKEIDAMNGLLRGSLTVASLPLYGSKLVSRWIAEYNTRHPQVSLSVRAAPSEDIEAGVLAGSIDLGVSFLPLQHSELTAQALFNDEIVLVASKQHPLAQKKSIEIADLQNLDMALPSERISAMRTVLRYFEEQEIVANVAISFDDGHALLEFIKDGRFVTMLPKQAISNGQDLRLIKLPPPGVPIVVGALWTHLTPAVQALMRIITDRCADLTSV